MSAHPFKHAIELIDREMERICAPLKAERARLAAMSGEPTLFDKTPDIDPDGEPDDPSEDEDDEGEAQPAKYFTLGQAIRIVLNARNDLTTKQIHREVQSRQIPIQSTGGIDQIRTALMRGAQRGWWRKRKLGGEVLWYVPPKGETGGPDEA